MEPKKDAWMGWCRACGRRHRMMWGPCPCCGRVQVQQPVSDVVFERCGVDYCCAWCGGAGVGRTPTTRMPKERG